jgi:endoglucanase
MRRRLGIACIGLCLASCLPRPGRIASGPGAVSDYVARHGALSVKGTALVDAKGDTVVLAGMSFGWHNWWPQYYRPEVVKTLRDDWRCTVLRAAMGVEHPGGYLAKPDSGLLCVTAVVEACIREGLYVIIDWHDHNAHKHPDAAVAFFREMAGRYGKHPNVMYEIYNEPTDADWPAVKAYSEAVISAVREIDPDNVILVGNPHWDQDVHVAADDPIRGFTNLLYTLHFYAGTHKAWLRERGDAALRKGIALFVSECGPCDASGGGPIDLAEWKAWMDWMAANRIGWCDWAVTDKKETCSVLKPGTSAAGGWKADDLTDSGRLARETIRAVNADAWRTP